MRDQFRLGAIEVAPDEYCDQMMLQAWAKSTHVNAGDRSETILRNLSQSGTVNTAFYCTVMKAHKGNADRVEALLHQMYGAYLQGNESLKPTRQAFHMVLESCSKSVSRQVADRAQALLGRMDHLSKSGTLQGVKPTTQTYNLVLNCLTTSQAKDAGDRAESLLREMQSEFQQGDANCEPTRDTFKAVMRAWAQVGRTDRVEAVLKELVGAYQNSPKASNRRLAPDLVSVHIVLQACRATRDAERAHRLLTHVEE